MAPVERRGPTIIRELSAPLLIYRLAPRAQRAYLGLTFASRDGISDGTICAAETHYYLRTVDATSSSSCATCPAGTFRVDLATIFAARDGISDGTICAAETHYYYYCATCAAGTSWVDHATILASRDGISDGTMCAAETLKIGRAHV